MAFLRTRRSSRTSCKAAIRAATLDITITPVLLGSAFKNKGVQPLLDAVIDYLPSPLDVPAGDRHRSQDRRARSSARRGLDAPFSALAFKVMTDPFVGKLTYFRVYSGKLNSGSYVLNAGHRPQGAGRPPAARCTPTTARTSTRSAPARSPPPSASSRPRPATRCATRGRPVLLEASTSPIRSSTWPWSRRPRPTRTSWPPALQRLAEEDPTFRVRTNEETGQTIIAGMGELHLEIIVDRLLREFKVDANVGRPQVAYRETIRNAVHGVRGKFVRQSGGRGQYGDAVIDMEPNSRATATSSRTRSSADRSPASTSRRSSRHPGGDGGRRAGRLPGGRHQGHAGRRHLPRRRLVGDGLQGGRLDGLQGGLHGGPSRCCWSRSWRSRWSRPRSTWAT